MIFKLGVLLAAALHFELAYGQCNNSIIGFTLIDADLDVEIGPLPSVIDYSSLPTKNLNVRADYISCADAPVASVYTQYSSSNSSDRHCERWTPYSVFYDNNPGGPDLGLLGPFNPFTFPLEAGQTIQALPYSGTKCTGTEGAAKVVKFDVVNTAAAPGKVLSFLLWDATNQTAERKIDNGARFCPLTSNYNIEARVLDSTTGNIGSVKISINGVSAMNATEKRNKYFLLGDFNGTIFGGGVLADGMYTLTAVPFSNKGGNGEMGQPLTVSFEISCACVNKITGFTLVDADLDVEIGPFPSVIDYATLPTQNLNVRADFLSCPGTPIDSVKLSYSGPNNNTQLCERWTPYSVFGDNNPGGPDLGALGKFYPFTFPVDPNRQTIQAFPYSGRKCNGVMGESNQVTFDVANSVTCPGIVQSFVLWDANTQSPEMGITDGSTFCPKTTNFNIQARTFPCQGGAIGSVKLQLATGTNSTIIHTELEKRELFFLYGDFNNTVFGGGKLADGVYQVSATPFTRKGGNGPRGATATASFTISCGKRRNLRRGSERGSLIR